MTDALRLWRGPALVDVPAGPVLESKRRQFEESRLVVLEYLVDAELRLGMYREVLTELAALTVENPCTRACAQYMRALYLSGRRAQALEVFHRLRSDLVNELGLEPGPQIQRLHQAVLNADDMGDDHLSAGRPLGDIIRPRGWATPGPIDLRHFSDPLRELFRRLLAFFRDSFPRSGGNGPEKGRDRAPTADRARSPMVVRDLRRAVRRGITGIR
ncbi:AfsR/SARP family transcriptional regulator [Micromonospora sp. BRA006-A]|nr:AfsR/SARP family transcriptional regulator [Micromonospora sp. BRA006-A]